jgi:hypothetical protein
MTQRILLSKKNLSANDRLAAENRSRLDDRCLAFNPEGSQAQEKLR